MGKECSQMIFTLNLRLLRPSRPFGYAQDILCGRYSEIRLRLARAGPFVVSLFVVTFVPFEVNSPAARRRR
jgi:hypothetical protein